MKTIQDIIQKPSQAARAMITGLQEHDARPYSEVEMSEYFENHLDICFACAATCAIQEITGVFFVSNFREDRADSAKINHSSFFHFEGVLEGFRVGDVEPVFEFFDHALPEELAKADWRISTHNWKQETPKVQEWIDRAEKLGC